jgi:hypothetical protein
MCGRLGVPKARWCYLSKGTREGTVQDLGKQKGQIIDSWVDACSGFALLSSAAKRRLSEVSPNQNLADSL